MAQLKREYAKKAHGTDKQGKSRSKGKAYDAILNGDFKDWPEKR